MDFMLGEKLSLDASLYWNPIRLDAFRSKLLIGQAGVRFWRFEPNVGPFVGTYIAAGRYDMGNRRRHHKGMLAGAGASYGYCWMLAKRWSLIAEIRGGTLLREGYPPGILYSVERGRDHPPQPAADASALESRSEFFVPVLNPLCYENP